VDTKRPAVRSDTEVAYVLSAIALPPSTLCRRALIGGYLRCRFPLPDPSLWHTGTRKGIGDGVGQDAGLSVCGVRYSV